MLTGPTYVQPSKLSPQQQALLLNTCKTHSDLPACKALLRVHFTHPTATPVATTPATQPTPAPYVPPYMMPAATDAAAAAQTDPKLGPGDAAVLRDAATKGATPVTTKSWFTDAFSFDVNGMPTHPLRLCGIVGAGLLTLSMLTGGSRG